MSDEGKFSFTNTPDFQQGVAAYNNISSAHVIGMFNLEKENCTRSPDHSRSRKRKVDKDGFVHPSTPDIPKSSTQYADVRTGRNKGNAATSNFSDIFNLGESLNSPEETEATDPVFDVEDSSEQDETTFENQAKNEVEESPYFGDNATHLEQNVVQPDQAGDHSGSHQSDSVDALLQGFGQEVKFLYENWGKTFKISEEFEMLCPQKLDLYIQRAQEIEKTLNQQKEELCHRLRGLGNTLQM